MVTDVTKCHSGVVVDINYFNKRSISSMEVDEGRFTWFVRLKKIFPMIIRNNRMYAYCN